MLRQTIMACGLTIFSLSHSAFAADLKQYIPDGWTITKTHDNTGLVHGDLNKDGIKDAALAIESSAAISEKRGCGKHIFNEKNKPRALLILFGKKDGGYELSARNDDIILRSGEGGVWGDPFEGLQIERGTLVIKHYGGSNWRWKKVHRFRYDSKNWMLIGQTEISHWTVNASVLEHDYNLLTGKIKISKEIPNRPKKSFSKWKQEKRRKITLSQATCWNFPFSETLDSSDAD